MHKKRGQISIELVITFGFALLMLIPLTILMYEHTTQTQDDIGINQAGLIARKITDTSNSVYYLGYPTSVTLKLYMPERINNISFQKNEIVILMETGQEIVSSANINLTGTISGDSGLMYLKVAAYENIVNITQNE